MIAENIEDRIHALSAEGKKLLLLKIKETVTVQAQRTTTSGRKRIVAYVQGHEGFSVDQLKADLQKKLPDYMVPSQFVPVTAMPVLPNGKIDRKQLHEVSIVQPTVSKTKTVNTSAATKVEQQLLAIWETVLGFSPIHKDDNFFEIGGDSILSIQIIAKARKEGIVLESNALFEHQTIAELSLFAETTQTVQKSNTTVSDKLLAIWEETLGFSPIHKDDNFFEIGGDSILSIQIIAKARKEGIILDSNHIFQHQTIAELSLFAKAETTEITQKVETGIVPLSPIQHWFFNDHKNAPHYWNQGVRLDMIPAISEKQVQEVYDYIITQHDALRSRFRHIENQWVQDIIAPEQIFAVEYVDLKGTVSSQYEQIVQEQMQRVQDQFIVSEGSLFTCLYFTTGTAKNDFCVLIAHHLIVDAVSWQIIIDDFTAALQQVATNKAIVKEAKTSSVKTWSEHLHTYVQTMPNEEIAFWTQQIAPVPHLPFDKGNSIVIEEKDVALVHFSLDKDTTKALQEANQAYHTKIEELLITAFVDTIGNWSTHQEIAIGFERHGRETLESGLDVSKTVGWFTSYFPVRFTHLSTKDIGGQIIAVKEQMRSVPNGGIGYGGLRYLKNAFGDIENPEIVFNFLGTKSTMVPDHGIKTTTLTENLRDPRSERHYKLEINVHITDDRLQGTCSFGNNIHTTDTISLLMNDFKKRIQEIGAYCSQTENGGYTPSDFSEADISQDDLDSLLGLLE